MQMLGNRTVIAQTYQHTLETRLFDEVWVATDSEIIYEEISKIGGHVVMSSRQHESGSDRIAEAIEKLEQLRYLKTGVSIRMIETSFTGIGIDTPEDLDKAQKLINITPDAS